MRTPAGLRKKKWVYGKTREEVHEKWTKLQQEARQGPLSTTVPTVGEHVSYWHENIIRPNAAPLTYQTYGTYIRHYLLPGIGSKRLDRLEVRDVQLWLNKVARTCQCCSQKKDARRKDDKRRCCAVGKCCEQRLAPRTIRDIRDVLRAALSHAQVEGLINRNVTAGVKLPKIRKHKRKAWSSDEARLFLESARTDGDTMYPLYVLVLALGLRKGEALGLTWDDIDIAEGELTVSHQLQRVSRQLLHRDTKTEGSEATLPLPDICVTALRLRQVTQVEAEKVAGPAWQGGKLVFTTRYGTPIEPRNLNRSWDARCAKAGVRKITIHDARRTCGTLLADLDVHPRVAMAILRHAQVSVTMEIYTMVSSKQTRAALKRLGDSLG